MTTTGFILPGKASLRRLKVDVLWNIASLGIMGVGGIVINIVILMFHEADTLGIFNQVYAVFIAFSQFAVAGVHFSTLKYVAEHQEDKNRSLAIVQAAVVLTFFLSLAFSLILWFVRGPIASILGSPGVGAGIAWAVPGLFFFALNKTLIAVLNGQQRMRLYAVFQAMRPLLMLVAVVAASLLGSDGPTLAVAFSFSESVLFVLLVISLRRTLFDWSGTESIAGWLRLHFDFGARSFLSGVLFDLNTRIDVLLLGWFSTDRVVGIYSFAAMLAEGFFQLAFIVRTNFNPLLVQMISSGRIEDLQVFARKGKRVTYAVMTVLGTTAVACYPVIIRILSMLGMRGAVLEAWPTFAILMAGIILSSGYLPFGTILQQAGRPGLNTITIGGAFMLNVIGNILLIPVLLSAGAALAAGSSFVFFAFLTWLTARRAIGVAI